MMTFCQETRLSRALDQQASRIARAFWSKTFVRCGDSYYSWTEDSIDGRILVQARGLSFSTQGGPPQSPRTKAEVLNAKEHPSERQWDGTSVARYETYRLMGQANRMWGFWTDNGNRQMYLQKNSGRWTILPTQSLPISCRDVNVFTLKSGSIATTTNPPHVTDDSLVFPATYPRWFSLGKGPFTLEMPSTPLYPRVWVSRSIYESHPFEEGTFPGSHNKNALAPAFVLGAFVAKIGTEGKPFQPFRKDTKYYDGSTNRDYRFSTSDEVFVAINDFNFSDNRGQYSFAIKDRGPLARVEYVGTTAMSGDHYTVSLEERSEEFDTGIEVKEGQHVSVLNYGRDESMCAFEVNVAGTSLFGYDEDKCWKRDLYVVSSEYLEKHKDFLPTHTRPTTERFHDAVRTVRIKVNLGSHSGAMTFEVYVGSIGNY